MISLTSSIANIDSFMNKYIDFDYLKTWTSELFYLKASIGSVNCSPLKVKPR